MLDHLLNGLTLGGVSILAANAISFVMVLVMARAERRPDYQRWALGLVSAVVVYNLLWILTLFRTPVGFETGYGEASAAAGLMLSALWLWPASKINALRRRDFVLTLIACLLLAITTVAILLHEFLTSLRTTNDYVQRLNYMASFTSFISVSMILRGNRTAGYTIAAWNLVNQALLLSKPGLLLMMLMGALILASTGGRVNLIKLLVGASVAVLLVPVGIHYFGDAAAAIQGYDSWDQFVDVRITRENYIMDDYRLFGVISDGGRFSLWAQYLTLAVRENVWLGTGFGLRELVGIPDHNFLVFLISRFGILGLVIIPALLVKISSRAFAESRRQGMFPVTLCLAGYGILCLMVSEISLYPDVMSALFFSLGAVSGFGRRPQPAAERVQEERWVPAAA